MTRLPGLFAALLLMASGALPAKADAVADFYNGKVVTLTVGASAGGGYDTLARTVARFLRRHVPGRPIVVVRNMAGAGGIAATNHLFGSAEPDGTHIGLVQNHTPLAPLLGAKAARYDPTRFNWLGSPGVETELLAVRSGASVSTLDDVKRRETTVGAARINSTPAFHARLLNDVLGTRLKVVVGYPGQAEAFLAMARGEIDGYPNVSLSTLRATKSDWLSQEEIRAIVTYGPQKSSELAAVPYAPEIVTDAEGRLLLDAAFAPLALGWPFVMPPGVPADRLAAMRKALADTMADPEFLAEARRLGLETGAPRTGGQLQKVVADAYATPSRVVERLRKLHNPQ